MAEGRLNWDKDHRRRKAQRHRAIAEPGEWSPPKVWEKRKAALRTSATGVQLRFKQGEKP